MSPITSVHAATELLESDRPFDDQGNDMVIVTTLTENENHVNDRYALNKVRHARRAVVFVPSVERASQVLLLAADYIAPVPPIRPEHYIVAAREIELPDMTRAIAEFLATHSLDDLKIAFRPQRPLMNAVRRLRVEVPTAAQQPKPSLKLEDTHGYGWAKSWGLQLAEDIGAWRAGSIAWEDVDRGALLFGPPGCGKNFIREGTRRDLCDEPRGCVRGAMASPRPSRGFPQGHAGQLR